MSGVPLPPQSVGGSAMWGGPVPHYADTHSNMCGFDKGFSIKLLLIFCKGVENQLFKKKSPPPPQAGVKGKLGRLLGVFEVSSHASQMTLSTYICSKLLTEPQKKKRRCLHLYQICYIVINGVFVFPKAKPRSEAPDLRVRVDCD